MRASARRCAVIAPVGSEAEPARKAALFRELCSAHGLEAVLPGFDAEAAADPLTLDGIAAAEIVIADLSNARPSCYFELGYALALAKPVIVVARAGSPLHHTDPALEILRYETWNELVAILDRALAAHVTALVPC